MSRVKKPVAPPGAPIAASIVAGLWRPGHLAAIGYSDRYLKAPLPVLLMFRTVAALRDALAPSLDERYRLITYAMLVHSMDRRGSSPALQDVEVQERALNWWPQGFAQDSTLDAFQGLLQEMVGLGVLIETEGRYAIRSSRIAAMLGGRDEIERKLLEMSVMPGYQKLDTGSFRRLGVRWAGPRSHNASPARVGGRLTERSAFAGCRRSHLRQRGCEGI